MRHYVWWVRGAAHLAMAKVSAASARKVDPEATLHIITDDGTDLTDIVLGERSFYYQYPRHSLPMMSANLYVQQRFLYEAKINDDEIWFVDTDTLIVKPLELPLQCEMAVTWRDRVRTSKDGDKIVGVASQMPYNYGVLGTRHTRATAEAFLWLRERVRGYNLQHQQWYGNQLALSELAGPAPAEGVESCVDRRGIPWKVAEEPLTHVYIAKLPCDEWNYTPCKPDENIDFPRVLHFKGLSRKYMSGYSERLGFGAIQAPDAPAIIGEAA